MPEVSSSQPPSPTPHVRRRFSFRKTASIVFAVVALGFVIDVASWLYPAWKKSRAESFASQAQDAYEVENYQEAEPNVIAALKIRPNDGRFLRLAARVYAAQRKPEAISYFNSLLKHPDYVDRDRHEFIEFAFALRRPEIVAHLMREKPESLEDWQYLALWHNLKGDRKKAIEVARQAVATDERSNGSRLLLAQLLLESRDDAEIAEAKKILTEIASKPSRQRGAAIRLLTGFPLSQRELLQLARWLRDSPGLRFDDYFLSADLLVRANPNSLPALAREGISRFQRGWHLERAALGHWLNRHGLYEMTITNIPPDLRSPSLTAVHLDALMGAARWTNAMELGAAAERAGARELAAAIYRRLSTNSPVSTNAAEQLRRLKDRATAQ